MLQLTKKVNLSLANSIARRIKYNQNFQQLMPLKSTAVYSTSFEHKTEFFKTQYGLDEKDFSAIKEAAKRINHINLQFTNYEEAIRHLGFVTTAQALAKKNILVPDEFSSQLNEALDKLNETVAKNRSNYHAADFGTNFAYEFAYCNLTLGWVTLAVFTSLVVCQRLEELKKVTKKG